MSRCPCPLKRSSPLIQLQSSRTVSRSLCRKFTSLSVVLFIGVFVYLFDKEIAPAHKGLQFVKTRCTLNTSQITESVLCDCGVYTSSACYPCLLVLVWVNISERTTRDSNSQFGRDSAYLHENLYLLNHECYFQPPRCCHSNDDNKKTVSRKQTMLRLLDNPFTCYYNPHNSSQVFYYRHPFEVIIFSCVVFPSIGIIIGVCLLIHVSQGQEEEQVPSDFGTAQRSSRRRTWGNLLDHNLRDE